MDGIEIPRELADAEGVPEDLDANLAGPYEFPSPTRRRTSGVTFLAGAGLAALGAGLGLPAGLYVLAGVLLVIGLFHFLSAWEMNTNAEEALAAASREVSFPVGHASAAVTFEGWRSRPVWHVLVYAADDPPVTRGLVRVDAVSGAVLGETFEESVSST
jgi:hypothetical protein